MMNYPNDPMPTRIRNFTMDYKLDRMNRLLFFTVFIGQLEKKTLQFVCNGILIPLSFLFTCFVGFKIMKISFQKHVKSLQVALLFFGLSEIIVMQLFCSIFAVYYWTWGAILYEKEYGIQKPTCIAFLYLFNFAPAYLITVAEITIGYMVVFEIKKNTKKVFWVPLNSTCIGVFYIFILLICLWDFLALFIMTSITTVQRIHPSNYQSKCFVMMSPLFDVMGIIEWAKIFEWTARIFSHVVPQWSCIIYLSVILRIMYNQFQEIRNGRLLLRGDVQHHAGPTVVFAVTIMILVFESGFELFCDIHEINLHYSVRHTDKDFFFFLKDVRTVLKPIIFFLAPILFISLCSIQPHFQATMIRYLNDGQNIKVSTLKTIGGDIIIRAHYKKLPLKLTPAAQLYKSFLKFYIATVIWNKFIDAWEKYKRLKRFARRRNIVNKEIDREMKLRRKELLHKNAYKKSDIVDTVVTSETRHSFGLGENAVYSFETAV